MQVRGSGNEPGEEHSEGKEGGPPLATIRQVTREEEHSAVNSKLPRILISLRKMSFSSITFQNE